MAYNRGRSLFSCMSFCSFGHTGATGSLATTFAFHALDEMVRTEKERQKTIFGKAEMDRMITAGVPSYVLNDYAAAPISDDTEVTCPCNCYVVSVLKKSWNP